MKKIFLDANVLIDFIDPSRNKHKEAVEFEHNMLQFVNKEFNIEKVS